MSEIVTDLVVETNNAAAEAVARHYQSLLNTLQAGASVEATCEALDHGYDSDLDERTNAAQIIGFDHPMISDVFSRRLQDILRSGRGGSTHIGGADEQQGLFSLFGRAPKADARYQGPRRSRASALVQRYIRECRGYRRAEKSTTADASRLI